VAGVYTEACCQEDMWASHLEVKDEERVIQVDQAINMGFEFLDIESKDESEDLEERLEYTSSG